MTKFITIFSLFAGAASMGGLYVTLKGPQDFWIMIFLFGISLAVSIYVLFVPNTKFEQNVASKIRKYRYPGISFGEQEVGIQKGDFSILQNGPAVVEFEVPFAEVPSFEIINFKGNGDPQPVVECLTPHQAVIRRNRSGSYVRSEYRWVARGLTLIPK
ncbi:MAG: hypothetical protein NT002_12815 [candidate division Zixibacteria bacterium]|nr:hypothetical protein [candidate division Zixibacteria bacterium]